MDREVIIMSQKLGVRRGPTRLFYQQATNMILPAAIFGSQRLIHRGAGAASGRVCFAYVGAPPAGQDAHRRAESARARSGLGPGGSVQGDP
eukprot:scaffold20251_cov47-Prasinocladus_malaysianus.AAC.1